MGGKNRLERVLDCYNNKKKDLTHLVDNLGPIHFLNRLLTQLGQVLREALNIKKGSKLDGWKEFGQYI